MTIKAIFDEIAQESSTLRKKEILTNYKDNELLKRVLYLGKSKRIKFYIKIIPNYIKNTSGMYMKLEDGLNGLVTNLSSRGLTGNLAVKYLQSTLGSVSEDDSYIIERVIEKDLKIGLGGTEINKIYPNLIEKTYYKGALAYNSDKLDLIFEDGKEGICEVKADGRYVNILTMGHESELLSRAGEITLITGSSLLDELAKFEDCVLNGELVIDKFDRMTANGLITSIIEISKKLASDDPTDHKKAEESKLKIFKKHNVKFEELLTRIRFIVWDILDVEDYFTNVSTVPRIDRLNRLIQTIADQKPKMISVVEYRFVKNRKEAMEYLTEVLERGEEGLVIKDFYGLWRDGKHWDQLKLKIEFDLDLKVIGFNYGNKGTKNENVISSVLCESSCGKLRANAQGIKEDKMLEITANQESLLGTIVKVKCNGLSSNSKGGFSLLYPSLKEFRDDKTTADSYEECLAIDLATKGLIREL